MKRTRNPEFITGRIKQDGTLLYGSAPFSINKVGTGVYDIYFPSNVRPMSVVASTESTSYGATTIMYNAGINGFRIGINNTSSAAAGDVVWNFVATVIPV